MVKRGKFGMVNVEEVRKDFVWEEARLFMENVMGVNGSGVMEGREILRNVWEVPEVIVKGLEVGIVRGLLWKLGYMEGVLDEGGLKGLLGGDGEDGRVGKARCVFVHVQNGLGNRLRAMGSGIALAKMTGRVPVVVWERDAHLSARFGDLFKDTPVVGSRNPEFVLYRNLLIVEEGFPSWKEISMHDGAWRPYNYMSKDGEDSAIHYPLPVVGRGAEIEEGVDGVQVEAESGVVAPEDPIPTSAHIYVKTAYVVQTLQHVMNRRNVNSELRRLVPVPEVIKLFNTNSVAALQKSIGVHIRSRGLKRDNVGVDMGCEYTASGARVTEYWRRRTGPRVFIPKLKSYVKRDRNVTFFVAADDVEVVEGLKKKFPGRVLSISRKCDDRSPECVQYALADLMSLARSKKLLGSHWSSFTETASRLGGGKRIMLSGRDFGKREMGMRDYVDYAWANIQDRFSFLSRCKKDSTHGTDEERRR